MNAVLDRPLADADDIGGADVIVRRALAGAASALGLEPGELCGRSRALAVVHARQIAAHLLREAGLPLSAIGRALGGRDETTIRHSLIRMQARLQTSAALRAHVDDLRRDLRSGTPPLLRGLQHRPESDVGAVAIVHPRLSANAAEAMSSIGFTRLADTGRWEVWARHPAA